MIYRLPDQAGHRPVAEDSARRRPAAAAVGTVTSRPACERLSIGENPTMPIQAILGDVAAILRAKASTTPDHGGGTADGDPEPGPGRFSGGSRPIASPDRRRRRDQGSDHCQERMQDRRTTHDGPCEDGPAIRRVRFGAMGGVGRDADRRSGKRPISGRNASTAKNGGTAALCGTSDGNDVHRT